LKYRVVMTNVEVLMKPDGGMEKLLTDPVFTRKLLGITFDEAHCISKWGGFRPEYRQVSQLRYTLPQHVRFFLVTATCPKVVRDDIFDLLRIRKEQLFTMHRSNDRPNIRLTVRKMIHPANSFLDLAFLIPEPLPEEWRPPKVLIFFDNIGESLRAAKFLRRRLPLEKRALIRWFNSEMSAEYRQDGCEDLKTGRAWGFVATDSFGMVCIVCNWSASLLTWITGSRRTGC
jgi:superfamily II DNA helicase RecQ